MSGCRRITQSDTCRSLGSAPRRCPCPRRARSSVSPSTFPASYASSTRGQPTAQRSRPRSPTKFHHLPEFLTNSTMTNHTSSHGDYFGGFTRGRQPAVSIDSSASKSYGHGESNPRLGSVVKILVLSNKFSIESVHLPTVQHSGTGGCSLRPNGRFHWRLFRSSLVWSW